jgi:hypothetical protein
MCLRCVLVASRLSNLQKKVKWRMRTSECKCAMRCHWSRLRLLHRSFFEKLGRRRPIISDPGRRPPLDFDHGGVTRISLLHVANQYDIDSTSISISSNCAASSAAMSNPLAEYLSAIEARDARETAHEEYINACESSHLLFKPIMSWMMRSKLAC